MITCWSCDSHVTSVVVIATGEFRIDTTRSNIGVPLRTMTVSDNSEYVHVQLKQIWSHLKIIIVENVYMYMYV